MEVRLYLVTDLIWRAQVSTLCFTFIWNQIKIGRWKLKKGKHAIQIQIGWVTWGASHFFLETLFLVTTVSLYISGEVKITKMQAWATDISDDPIPQHHAFFYLEKDESHGVMCPWNRRAGPGSVHKQLNFENFCE